MKFFNLMFLEIPAAVSANQAGCHSDGHKYNRAYSYIQLDRDNTLVDFKVTAYERFTSHSI